MHRNFGGGAACVTGLSQEDGRRRRVRVRVGVRVCVLTLCFAILHLVISYDPEKERGMDGGRGEGGRAGGR